MGRDQYGQTFHDLGEHPRQSLLRVFGSKHAAKMYVDKKDGPPVHIGYIIKGHWITLYRVSAWEKPG